MVTIIAGSRSIKGYATVVLAAETAPWILTGVVSGGAFGVDKLGERLARDYSLPLTIFPAEWDKYGKRAGYLRNELMADNAEALIAVWDGISRGTGHMIDIARRKGLKVFVFQVNQSLPPS